MNSKQKRKAGEKRQAIYIALMNSLSKIVVLHKDNEEGYRFPRDLATRVMVDLEESGFRIEPIRGKRGWDGQEVEEDPIVEKATVEAYEMRANSTRNKSSDDEVGNGNIERPCILA